MPRLRKLTHMCSRTISGTVYRFRHGSTLCSPTVEKILCRSPFRSGHMSAICARLSNKGKTGVQRGRETVGVPSFLPTAVGTALSQPRVRQSPALRRAQLLAEFQRKTLRPLGTNTLAQFEYPAQPVLRNAARIGRTACAVRASQRVGSGIACVAVKPPQLHINYVCVTPTYTV